MRDWESKVNDYENMHSWQVSRYWDTRNRYLLNARHELGYQFKEYCDKGKWKGAPEHVNRLYENLQCELALSQISDLKVSRNFLKDDIYMFEINQWQPGDFCEKTYKELGVWKPIKSILCIKDRVLCSDAKQLKDGYRYKYGVML